MADREQSCCVKTRDAFIGMIGLLALGMPVANAQAPTPSGVPAPSGYEWTLTFDDEFTRDSGLNQSLWNGGASNTDWCASTQFWYANGAYGNNGGNWIFTEPENTPCQNNPGSISFDSSLGLGMQTGAQSNNGLIETGPPDAAIQSGGPTASTAKFVQMYGYWEASVMKSPATGGPHFDFWMHPIPECNDGTQGCWLPQIDVGEQPAWDASEDNSETYLYFGYDDSNGNSCGGVINVGVDLTADFHTYAVWWNNDGSGPYGSFTFYFDGTPVIGPCVASAESTNLASGIYQLLSVDGGATGNTGYPDWVRYVRVWELTAVASPPPLPQPGPPANHRR
jgi:Glycosyl hydrolases family 16